MIQYNTVEEALEALRKGHIIMVTDDADRENEGDFICAAEFATTENINFMATHGKGLICMPMSAAYERSFSSRRWFPTIQTIMRPHLPFPLTVWIPRPAFPRRNGP